MLGSEGVGVKPLQIDVHTACQVASSRTMRRSGCPMPLQHVSEYGFVLRRAKGIRVPAAGSVTEPPQAATRRAIATIRQCGNVKPPTANEYSWLNLMMARCVTKSPASPDYM